MSSSCLQPSRIIVLIASVVLFCGCFSFAAFAKEKRQVKSAEVSALLRLFMIPGVPWDTGSKGELPIIWKHAGIKDCGKDFGETFASSLCRTGEVVLTVKGKVTHKVLGVQLEPGRWIVTIIGSHAGGDYVLINSDVNSGELEQNFIRSIDRQLPLTQIKKCEADGSTLYRTEGAGKKPMFVIESASCGSGGCAISLLLGSNEDDMRSQIQSSCN